MRNTTKNAILIRVMQQGIILHMYVIMLEVSMLVADLEKLFQPRHRQLLVCRTFNNMQQFKLLLPFCKQANQWFPTHIVYLG